MGKNRQIYAMLQALLAAALFGASAPLAKLLLGQIEPIVLAALLYLGSGLGLLAYRSLKKMRVKNAGETEARVGRSDVPWLIGAVLAGGVAAPIVLMFGLKATPAATASLLLNFESVATTMIAIVFFKEAIGRRIWLAVAAITGASIILSWNSSGEWGISLGALGVLAACVLWGMDNNFTRNISAKDPLVITMVKGISAGSFSLILALILRNGLPSVPGVMEAMVLGFFSYGLSITLFIHAMRNLGAARTSALFGTAPYVGALLSFILFKEMPNVFFLVSLPLMIGGAVLLLGEEHEHEHIHDTIEHDHNHTHDDDHHTHRHAVGEEPILGKAHSHVHQHDQIRHHHPHTPDIHHRHKH